MSKDIRIALYTVSKVTAVLLNRWILPIGGVTSVRVCAQPEKACVKKLNRNVLCATMSHQGHSVLPCFYQSFSTFRQPAHSFGEVFDKFDMELPRKEMKKYS